MTDMLKNLKFGFYAGVCESPWW